MERTKVTNDNRWQIVIRSASEVGPALFFSLLIITVSFIPVFTLEAQEGRMFAPLAFTKTYAMAASFRPRDRTHAPVGKGTACGRRPTPPRSALGRGGPNPELISPRFGASPDQDAPFTTKKAHLAFRQLTVFF